MKSRHQHLFRRFLVNHLFVLLLGAVAIGWLPLQAPAQFIQLDSHAGFSLAQELEQNDPESSPLAENIAPPPAIPQGVTILSVNDLAGTAGTIRYFTMVLPDGYDILEFTVLSYNGNADVRWSQNGYDTTSSLPQVPIVGNSARIPGRPGIYYLTVTTRFSYNNFDFNFKAYSSAKAQIVSPINGSTLGSNAATFQWDAGFGAVNYSLWLGTSPDLNNSAAYNLHNAGLLSSSTFTRTVTTLPVDGSLIYATLWSLINGVWVPSQHVYTAYTAPSTARKARLLTPTPGSVLSDTTVTFTWDAGVGVNQYSLWVGTASQTNTAGAYNLHNAGLLNSTYTRTVATIPLNGAPVYVTLWSVVNGAWQHSQYVFTAPSPVKARMTTPAANDSTLGSGNVTFAWDAGRGASAYSLWVGGAPSTYDLHNAGLLTTRSRFVAIPADGRIIYVTLWSLINGAWQASHYRYKLPVDTASGKARMISPTPEVTLGGGTVTFTWNAAAGGNQYSLWAGTAQGTYNLANTGLLTNQTMTTIILPTDGRDLHVTLWTRVNNAWLANYYRYTAYSPPGGAFRAQLTGPTPSSTLAEATATFTWDAGVGSNQYTIWVGTSPDGSSPEAYNLHNAGLLTSLNARTVKALPVDGSPLYVTLFTFLNGTWQARNSYSFTAARLVP